MWSQTRESPVPNRSDQFGLRDELEQSLLQQFVPDFRIGQHYCCAFPGECQPGRETLLLAAENGTVYGQVFPVRSPGTG